MTSTYNLLPECNFFSAATPNPTQSYWLKSCSLFSWWLWRSCLWDVLSRIHSDYVGSNTHPTFHLQGEKRLGNSIRLFQQQWRESQIKKKEFHLCAIENDYMLINSWFFVPSFGVHVIQWVSLFVNGIQSEQCSVCDWIKYSLFRLN